MGDFVITSLLSVKGEVELMFAFVDTVLVLMRLSPAGFSCREEERLDSAVMITTKSSGAKKTGIAMSLGEHARKRRIA